MPPAFKRVPAVEKCFAILELLTKTEKPLGISDISRQLTLNKSTVFNMVYTLIELDVLEGLDDGKFGLGTRFYVLGNASGRRSELIQVARPFLEKINRETKLSAFLGIRSELRAVLIDKVDSAHDIKISSEIGMQMPVLAGAGIKAMLSLLSDEKVDALLDGITLKKYTPRAISDKRLYKAEIEKVREEGLAFDREEYIEGMVAVGVPIRCKGRKIEAAIWAVGLKQQVSKEAVPNLNPLLKQIGLEINQRL
ncbi:IclR family transcriptional regulator [Desulfosarcina ovata subsp. sediminis]|uniref:IclR family transcriptional regulator n=1 Tax=Desulfosarcina ovata subsp. sediminis TaxID=885957 RepID=A0A5K7ZMS1_9BACT|nr:IclR family transcriptional regulator [Desulfosarcina ovata]BBO81467.1 IclR family transcriptional regulator [Desulfosarcina ovata subsp. sediminis]